VSTKRFTKVSLLVAVAVLVATQAGPVWGLATGSPDLKQIYSLTGVSCCVPGVTPDWTIDVSARVQCPGAGVNAYFGTALMDGGDGGVCDQNPLCADPQPTEQAAAAAAALCAATPGDCYEITSPTLLGGACPSTAAPIVNTLAACTAALTPTCGGLGAVYCPITTGNGFIIDSNGFRFSVERCGNCRVQDMDADLDNGCVLYDDPPANLLIRLDPESSPRPFTVDFTATGAPGPGPASFTLTIDSVPGGANPTTDQEIAQAACLGFSNAGVTANAEGPENIGRFAIPPSAGWFLELKPGTSVTEIGVTPHSTGTTLATQPNLTMHQESIPPVLVGSGSAVPTLSEWGMAILVIILLMTGVWMLRKRQRLQQS
jgi:hypothetical protein